MEEIWLPLVQLMHTPQPSMPQKIPEEIPKPVMKGNCLLETSDIIYTFQEPEF